MFALIFVFKYYVGLSEKKLLTFKEAKLSENRVFLVEMIIECISTFLRRARSMDCP